MDFCWFLNDDYDIVRLRLTTVVSLPSDVGLAEELSWLHIAKCVTERWLLIVSMSFVWVKPRHILKNIQEDAMLFM